MKRRRFSLAINSLLKQIFQLFFIFIFFLFFRERLSLSNQVMTGNRLPPSPPPPSSPPVGVRRRKGHHSMDLALLVADSVSFFLRSTWFCTNLKNKIREKNFFFVFVSFFFVLCLFLFFVFGAKDPRFRGLFLGFYCG